MFEPSNSANHISGIIGKTLWKELKPYQRKGVRFYERRNGINLLADDPGLGKTFQTLAWLSMHRKLRTVCVVPATIKWNWVDEIKKWTPYLKPIVLSGRTTYRLSFKHDFVIINYDILSSWVDELKKWGPDVLILDESHLIKNSKTLRTRAAMKLSKVCKHRICLTGTPVVNAPVEYYQTLKLLDPTIFPSFWRFAHHYCNARNNGFGWTFKGSKNELELHRILTKDIGIMKRRLREDVLPELPPVTRTIIPLHFSSTEIRETESLLDMAVDSGNTMNMLAAVEKMRQVCLKAKLPQVIDWIKTFLEGSEEKLVVFGWHKIGLHSLKTAFPNNSVLIDGSITGIKRHNEILRFRQNKDIRLLFGNMKAAGVGINLTEANHVLIIEMPWTPADLKQAEHRVIRLGQKRPVNIWYLLVADSIETKMMELIDQKAEIISKVMNGVKIKKSALLMELLKKHK